MSHLYLQSIYKHVQIFINADPTLITYSPKKHHRTVSSQQIELLESVGYLYGMITLTKLKQIYQTGPRLEKGCNSQNKAIVQLSEVRWSDIQGSECKPATKRKGKFYGNMQSEQILYNKLNKMSKKILKKGEGPKQWQTQLYDRITRLQAQVLQRIQKLKSNNKSFMCDHFNISILECEPYDHNINYYDKFWKRFLLNEIGRKNVSQFRDTLTTFDRKLDKIHDLFRQWQKEVQTYVQANPPRSRKGTDGPRQVCPHCSRTYKDRQTLMIHNKIKHSSELPPLSQEKCSEDIFQEDYDEE